MDRPVTPRAAVLSTTAADKGFSQPYRIYVLAVLFVVYFFNFMDRTILGVLMPAIKKDLVLLDWQLGLLGGGAFSLIYAFAGMPIARLVDRGSRVNILSISIAVWSAMTMVCGVASGFWHLIAARGGVGVGEAGASPSCTTLLSDLFGPRTRATAIGIYTSGLAFGSSAGLLMGALFAAEYGWRVAFILIGAPGLLLSLLVKLTVREPPRGLSDEGELHDSPVSMLHVVKVLLSRPTFRHYVLGHSLSSLNASLFLFWTPSYLLRSFDVDLKFVGIALAVTTCVAGVVGAAAGGAIADRLSLKSVRWRLLSPAVANLAAVPVSLIGYTTSNIWVALVALCLSKMAPHTITGPGGSMVQQMVGLRMRATAQAFNLLVVSIIAGTLGPLAVGAASDLLAPRFGDESLRISLIGSVAILGWAAVHYYLASRHIEEDLRRVPGV
jgi:MFS family permease